MLTDISGGSVSILRPGCFTPHPKDSCSNLTFCSAYPSVASHVCLTVQSVQDAATPPLIRPSLHRFLSSPLTSSFNRAFRQFGGRWVTGDDIDGVGTKSWRVRMSRREGLWRSRNMAIEVVEVVQELKRTKGVEIKISAIMEGKGARLMKSDLLSVLEELQRQELWFLALKVRHRPRQFHLNVINIIMLGGDVRVICTKPNLSLGVPSLCCTNPPCQWKSVCIIHFPHLSQMAYKHSFRDYRTPLKFLLPQCDKAHPRDSKAMRQPIF